MSLDNTQLRGQFAPLKEAQFTVAGFVADDQDYILLLMHYSQTIAQPGIATVQTGYRGLTLHEVQAEGRRFRAQFESEKEIFSPEPDAVARQKSLGYVCYQMLRRLKRLEAAWMDPHGKKEIDYNTPLMQGGIAEMIRFKIEGIVNDDGYFDDTPYHHVRAAQIPVAMPHERDQYVKLDPRALAA